MTNLEKFLSLRSFVNSVESKGLVYGASFSEFVILRAIDADGDSGVRRVDLAKAVELSVSGVTRALQPLEKQGSRNLQWMLVSAELCSLRLAKNFSTTSPPMSTSVSSR
jgi:DNA-binding MarR family transcriptional regulator